jgi:hypothetical protein
MPEGNFPDTAEQLPPETPEQQLARFMQEFNQMKLDLQSLGSVNTALQDTNHDLRDVNDNLRDQLDNFSNTGVSTRKRSPKVATPDPFSGDRKKAKSFLRQVLVYVAGKSDEFPDDSTKVLFMLSYMKDGLAGKWGDARATSWYVLQSEPVPTWMAFLRLFGDQFRDTQEAETARSELDSLSQGCLSADEYILMFQEIAALTGYNDVALVDKFERGLHSALRKRIYDLPDVPTTLEDWYKYALRFEANWKKYKSKETSSDAPKAKETLRALPRPTPTAPVSMQRAPAFTPTAAVVVPMDVDCNRA